jgi:maleylpyruvate isomerase
MEDTVLRLAQVRTSTAALVGWLETTGWSDADVGADSLLPGWTRGHVLTHLARNADGISRTLSAMIRGEIVERYPGGPTARDDAINAGARRSAAELTVDVRESAERLDRVLGAVADEGAWDRPSTEERAGHEWLVRRWREVEIHRVDLRGDYGPENWPPELVAYLLDAVAVTVNERASEPVRVEVSDAGVVIWAGGGEPTTILAPGWAVAAWLTGRELGRGPMTNAPSLQPWI